MSDDTTMNRLTSTMQKVDRLEETHAEASAEIEDGRQQLAAAQRRITDLEKTAATAGKFDVKQIVAMLFGSGGVASVVSGLVMYAITSEQAKVVKDVEDNQDDLTKLTERADRFDDRLRLAETTSDTALKTSQANKTEADKFAAIVEARTAERWRASDQARYAQTQSEARRRAEQVDDALRHDLTRYAERLSFMEGQLYNPNEEGGE